MRLVFLGNPTCAGPLNFSLCQAVSWSHARSCPDAERLAVDNGADAFVIEELPPLTAGRAVRTLRSSLDRKVATRPTLLIMLPEHADAAASLLDAGADDVVQKGCPTDEIIARLRAIIRRGRGIPGPALSCGPVTLDLNLREARVEGRVLAITATEFHILRVMIERRGSVVSHATLLSLVCESGDRLDGRSLDAVIRRVRRKLQAADARGLLSPVSGSGYVMRVPARTDGELQPATTPEQRMDVAA